MAEKAGGRPRPSYKPNAEYVRRLREQAGLSIVDFAEQCGIGEKTLRKVLAGDAVDFATLDRMAGKLRLGHWHELLDPAERAGLATVPPTPVEPSVPPPSVVPAPPTVVNRLFQLPAAVADFTGRHAELARMAALLRGDGGRVGVSALRGMGGVGKTSLAVKVAHEVRDHFSDAQLLVELRGTADQPMSATEAMARIIRDFHPEARLPDTEAELLPLYRSVLAGKRALVVLDNAKDEEQVRLLVTAPPPAGFVVTSRAALALDGVESIRLDVLPPAEALALLRGIVGPKGTDDELRAVADLCGRLPLALRVAGHFLQHANWDVPRYAAALRDGAKRWEKLRGKTTDRDVEAVLALSAAELVKANPEQAERWQLLSVFPADFDALATAAVWDLKAGDKLDTVTVVDELTALLDRSLIQYDEQTDRYSLHDLMRPVAREAFEYVDGHPLHANAEERIRTAERRFVGHYRDVLASGGSLYLRGNNGVVTALALFDRELHNVEAGWTWACANQKSDQFATEMCRDYPNRGASLIQLRLPVWTQLRWLEHAVEACRILSDRRGEAIALGNLGIAHAQLGDARVAITFYEQVLVIAREIGDQWIEGRTLGNLGIAHKNLGDARAAITFHEQRLVIARETGDRRGEGNALGNLGVAYAELGDARAAITFYEQHLAVARETGDRRGEGNALGNLGAAHCDLGDARTAITFHEQRLVIAREIGDRRGEGIALGNLGSAHANLGDARAAITFHEQQLVIARETGDRRGEGIALGNLGNAHKNLGDARAAIGFYEQRLFIAREIGDRQGEAITNWNMASALRTLGQRREAIPFAEQSLAFFESLRHSSVEERRQELVQWRTDAEATA